MRRLRGARRPTPRWCTRSTTATDDFEHDDPFRYSNLPSGEANTLTAAHCVEHVIYQCLEFCRPKRGDRARGFAKKGRSRWQELSLHIYSRQVNALLSVITWAAFVGRRRHTAHCAEARLRAVFRMRITCQFRHERVTADRDGPDRIHVVFAVPRARRITSWNGASPTSPLAFGRQYPWRFPHHLGGQQQVTRRTRVMSAPYPRTIQCGLR